MVSVSTALVPLVSRPTVATKTVVAKGAGAEANDDRRLSFLKRAASMPMMTEARQNIRIQLARFRKTASQHLQ